MVVGADGHGCNHSWQPFGGSGRGEDPASAGGGDVGRYGKRRRRRRKDDVMHERSGFIGTLLRLNEKEVGQQEGGLAVGMLASTRAGILSFLDVVLSSTESLQTSYAICITMCIRS